MTEIPVFIAINKFTSLSEITMSDETLDTHQKALAYNMERSTYGTIAEIGAGQETVRWFFRVGGAAGSIAKSMSAYDMQFSDAIYGEVDRYVSRERVHDMIKKEYDILIQRLDDSRGKECAFFSFANTVTTYNYTKKSMGHGWLGIRFQPHPGEEFSEIHLHVSLKGTSNYQDQETIGILGVNLIYGTRFLNQTPLKLLLSLMDNLSRERLEIDNIDFSGPAFSEVDNRIMALKLVQHGLTHTTMFQADGKLVLPAEVLYKKAVLVERSRFRPPTHLNIDMLNCALKAFKQETNLNDENIVVISEMTLPDLDNGDAGINIEDFLQRVDILCALGKNVMISSYVEFYKLSQYLFKRTQSPVAVILGIPTLYEVFKEAYYKKLDGGILEAFGKLFRHDMRMYVCPTLDKNGKLITIDNIQVKKHLRHLYHHLLENGYLRNLDTINQKHLLIHAEDVLENIRHHENNWETMVPQKVADMINERNLFR